MLAPKSFSPSSLIWFLLSTLGGTGLTHVRWAFKGSSCVSAVNTIVSPLTLSSALLSEEENPGSFYSVTWCVGVIFHSGRSVTLASLAGDDNFNSMGITKMSGVFRSRKQNEPPTFTQQISNYFRRDLISLKRLQSSRVSRHAYSVQFNLVGLDSIPFTALFQSRLSVGALEEPLTRTTE